MSGTAIKAKASLVIGFSTLVIFQMRCADPLKDSGADTTTFSDASLRVIFLFYSSWFISVIITDMNTHKLQLATLPFDAITSGAKTIESRLYDEKRQTIQIGDTVIFTN